MSEPMLDEWKITLQQKKAELESCQKDKNLQSCMKCDQLFVCKLREMYIKAVYESMNKGKSGGFEF